MNNKAAKVRQQAADLISKIANVMKTCQEEKLMGHLGVVLYEYLGEEYPEVLGSILGALKAIVNVIGMHKMTPPIKDLLPRLTPILKNRHEKVKLAPHCASNFNPKLRRCKRTASTSSAESPIVVPNTFPRASGCEFASNCSICSRRTRSAVLPTELLCILL